jgi:uncharacterized protein YciI
MYFIVLCTDKPDHLALRESIRQEHRRYLREVHPLKVLQGGPTLDADALMSGTALVVEAEHQDQVATFIANDPYSKADLFLRTEIRPWMAVQIDQSGKI